jgi:hypothetical protein
MVVGDVLTEDEVERLARESYKHKQQENELKELLSFMNKRAGTQRMLDGSLSNNVGLVPLLNSLIQVSVTFFNFAFFFFFKFKWCYCLILVY